MFLLKGSFVISTLFLTGCNKNLTVETSLTVNQNQDYATINKTENFLKLNV